MQQLINLKQNEIELTEDGEIIGLYILRGNESITSSIKFVHKKPGLDTNIKLKFILLDNARIDLEATVVIDKGAERTNTYLKIDTLLLSETANARVIPSMEIKEDEVKGGHGATIGMLDRNQLFYLMSRGLSQEQAETILIEGFVNDMILQAESENLRSKFQKELEKLKKHI